MFIQPNFTFNNQYSRDLGVSIITFDSGVFNDVGIEYAEDVNVDQSLIEYNPYYTSSISETKEIELNLVVYNPLTMEPIDFFDTDIESLYDWLITDNFSQFISDDDTDLIYYFKVIRIQKVLTFENKGYLRVTLKPFSKYAYKKREYEFNINGETTIDIFNLSRLEYFPIIEIINKGNISTINKINNMDISNVKTNEKIIIDNLTKIVQNENGENKFNTCNRRWIKFTPREINTLILNGNMSVKIICEFPVVL